MNKHNLRPTAYKFIATALLLSFSACDPGAYQSYPSSSYGGGYSDPYRHDSYESRRDWEHEKREERERRDLERERQRLNDERRRLEDEQRHHQAVTPPPPPKLNCPPGTHPSTHRCTSDERKRGCKDYGGPNGQGCSNF